MSELLKNLLKRVGFDKFWPGFLVPEWKSAFSDHVEPDLGSCQDRGRPYGSRNRIFVRVIDWLTFFKSCRKAAPSGGCLATKIERKTAYSPEETLYWLVWKSERANCRNRFTSRTVSKSYQKVFLNQPIHFATPHSVSFCDKVFQRKSVGIVACCPLALHRALYTLWLLKKGRWRLSYLLLAVP